MLRLWIPALVVLAMIAFSLANLDATDVPDGYAGVLLVIGLLVLLWAMNVLVIASLFTFRARDLARLGAYYLARLPLVSLGVASQLLVLAAGIVYVTFDAVLVLLGGGWAALLLRNARPVVRDVTARFTRRSTGTIPEVLVRTAAAGEIGGPRVEPCDHAGGSGTHDTSGPSMIPLRRTR